MPDPIITLSNDKHRLESYFSDLIQINRGVNFKQNISYSILGIRCAKW